MAIIGFLFGLGLFLPGFVFHREPANTPHTGGKILTVFTALAAVLITTLPMTLAPYWNGTVKGHRNQYELIAESFLHGRLDFEYTDIDPRLGEMENPYDYNARKAAGVRTHWDHAYYQGHYYMYFGVAPVLLTFLPYRAVFGRALNTMRATQLFTGIAVFGIFALFRLLARRFFPKMTLGTYLILSLGVSVISFWYAAGFAALYCTAIVSAVCMEVWSFYFFFKAVYEEPKENRQILYAALGALFGALAFGCRPTVALANFLVIPLLAAYIGRKKTAGELNWKLLPKLILAALPYVIVAAGLMLYNYARFDDPFEFGQSYQLTVADQHNYGSFLTFFDPLKLLNGIVDNFFTPGKYKKDFPWVSFSGACWNFPLLLLGAGLLLPRSLRAAKEKRLCGVMTVLFLLPLLITVFDIVWTPYLLERYRLDIYFLMGIAVFCSVGFLGERIREQKDAAILRGAVTVLSLAAMMSALLLWLVPYDANYTQNVGGEQQKAAYLLFFLKLPS